MKVTKAAPAARLMLTYRSLETVQASEITSVTRDTYRHARMDCSTHEMLNWEATKVMVSLAPAVDFERGRKMVDAILFYVEARHRDWFGKGLQGDRQIASFLRY